MSCTEPVDLMAIRGGNALARPATISVGAVETPVAKTGRVTRLPRNIAEPFIVAPPSGSRVRTRLVVARHEEEVLWGLGAYLGSLASKDLTQRCHDGRLTGSERSQSRRERKRGLTSVSSSRWAGAITRTSEDAWQLAYRNLEAEKRSLRARISRIRRRLAVPAGGRRGRLNSYATPAERFEKQKRLQNLVARLGEVEARLDAGKVSICRGGLAKSRHHLGDAEMTEAEWRGRWETSRLFLTADGEKDKTWGNETIRFDPDERVVEIKLPGPLAHLSNRPHGRYRLSCPVVFSYLGEEVGAQAGTGAIRYDISYHSSRRRWYLDASWTFHPRVVPTLDDLRAHRVLAVDMNAGHLAAIVVDPSGNPVGSPITIEIDLAGQSASTRHGRLRAAISQLVHYAQDYGCHGFVIEDLDFCDARELGREQTGSRPNRGMKGRSFRRLVAGIPTAKFRDRLVQMATNAGLTVVAVDPAYTSKWGAEHWLGVLQKISSDASGHHTAALAIGRRGLKPRVRRRERCDSTPAEHGEQRATDSAVRATPAMSGLFEPRTRESAARKARGQPHRWQKTQSADRSPPEDQVDHDRSGPPTGRDSLPPWV